MSMSSFLLMSCDFVIQQFVLFRQSFAISARLLAVALLKPCRSCQAYTFLAHSANTFATLYIPWRMLFFRFSFFVLRSLKLCVDTSVEDDALYQQAHLRLAQIQPSGPFSSSLHRWQQLQMHLANLAHVLGYSFEATLSVSNTSESH